MSDIDSVAFTIIGDLLKANKIDENDAQFLRTKYQKLFEQYVAAKEQEQALIKKSKNLGNEILKEKVALEKSRIEESEVSATLSKEEGEKELLQSDYDIAEQRSTMANFELQELQKTHEDLKEALENMKRENNSLVEPVLAGLRSEIADLKVQLNETGMAFEREGIQKETLLQRTEDMESAKLGKKADLENVLEDYKKVESVPDRLRRQLDSIERAATSMEADYAKVQRKIKYLNGETDKVLKRKDEVEKVRKSLNDKLTVHCQTIEQREQEVAVVRIHLENEISRGQDLSTAKLELTVKKKEVDSKARHCADQLSMARKEFEQLKRQLKRKRGIADTVKQVIPTLEDQLNDQDRYHKSFMADNQGIKKDINKKKEEIDEHIAQLLVHESVEAGKAQELEVLREEVESEETENARLMSEVKRQAKLISVLSAQRDIKARDSARVDQKEKEARQYVHMKELMILDLTKRCNEINNRLKEFTALNEVVKNERNKYVNLIQSSTQALAEIREKIRILTNEVEILANESSTKDKVLTKERISHQQAQNQRDASRQDMNKLLSDYRAKQGVVEQQIMEIDKLNAVINALEKDMLHLKKRYERAVAERNATGVQLIERNDELCILYERSNQQQDAMRKGELKLNEKREELRSIRLQTEELRRQYTSAKKRLPEMDSLREKISVMEKKLVEIRKTTEALSNRLEDPQNLDRWRPLDGEDPGIEQLIGKIKILEDRLNAKREQLLEKELVLEEVTSLTERLRQQAAKKRDYSKSMADQLNELQSRIRDTTKKMLATVSELSIYQATALQLQQEKMRRETELDEMKWKLDHGECPNEDTAKEWAREERKAKTHMEFVMKQEEKMATMAVSGPAYVKTTAEPRPTAYIPDELGIPKPYGLLAPFKPTEQGSTMRHIRLPNPKPVEI